MQVPKALVLEGKISSIISYKISLRSYRLILLPLFTTHVKPLVYIHFNRRRQENKVNAGFPCQGTPLYKASSSRSNTMYYVGNYPVAVHQCINPLVLIC